MATDTTDPNYWLNWRFLLSAIWIALSMIFSALLIWRYEGRDASRPRPNGAAGGLNRGDSWGTCWKSIHPIWLLVFRIFAFCAMLAVILADTILDGVGIFYYYTQWTFTLVTIYFGIGSSLSIIGCLQCRLKTDPKKDRTADSERGSFVGEDADTYSTNVSLNGYNHPMPATASIWEYTFQIIFQIGAGAVVLTDLVYWLILYPSYDGKDITFLDVSFHSLNAVFLLGDTVLNSMRFPFFRIAYFTLYTCVFVIFQWTIHVFVSMSWPYSFLDLASSYAPLWYVGVGLMHIPCFGIFYILFKIKHYFEAEKARINLS